MPEVGNASLLARTVLRRLWMDSIHTFVWCNTDCSSFPHFCVHHSWCHRLHKLAWGRQLWIGAPSPWYKLLCKSLLMLQAKFNKNQLRCELKRWLLVVILVIQTVYRVFFCLALLDIVAIVVVGDFSGQSGAQSQLQTPSPTNTVPFLTEGWALMLGSSIPGMPQLANLAGNGLSDTTECVGIQIPIRDDYWGFMGRR